MNAPESIALRKEAFEANKLKKRLRRLVGQAIRDFSMIEAGDRVMVCLSGGKDSYGLLDVLMTLREHAPLDFEIVAVNLDREARSAIHCSSKRLGPTHTAKSGSDQ
jgi:tRNA 2-thiocytidine biosynthesis protein TtcA